MFEIIAIFVILALIGIDQLTKWLAVTHLQGEPAVLWEGVFELRYVENDGMAWGLFGGEIFRWVVVSITAVLMVALLYMLLSGRHRNRWLSVSLVLIVAGGVGNLIDRVFVGYVVDFLEFTFIDFPVFNVADICVVFGAGIMIVYALFFNKTFFVDKKPAASTNTEEDSVNDGTNQKNDNDGN